MKIIFMCSRDEGLALNSRKVQDFVIDECRAYFEALYDQATIAEDGAEPYVLFNVDSDLVAMVSRS